MHRSNKSLGKLWDQNFLETFERWHTLWSQCRIESYISVTWEVVTWRVKLAFSGSAWRRMPGKTSWGMSRNRQNYSLHLWGFPVKNFMNCLRRFWREREKERERNWKKRKRGAERKKAVSYKKRVIWAEKEISKNKRRRKRSEWKSKKSKRRKAKMIVDNDNKRERGGKREKWRKRIRKQLKLR